MSDYDWHFDRDGDGSLDAHERYDRDDFDDYLARRNYYSGDKYPSSSRGRGKTRPLYWIIMLAVEFIILKLFPSSPALPLIVGVLGPIAVIICELKS